MPTACSVHILKHTAVVCHVNVVKVQAEDEADNVDCDEESVTVVEAMVCCKGLVFDEADQCWRGAEADVLDGSGETESCSHGVFGNDIRY